MPAKQRTTSATNCGPMPMIFYGTVKGPSQAETPNLPSISSLPLASYRWAWWASERVWRGFRKSAYCYFHFVAWNPDQRESTLMLRLISSLSRLPTAFRVG